VQQVLLLALRDLKVLKVLQVQLAQQVLLLAQPDLLAPLVQLVQQVLLLAQRVQQVRQVHKE
jgi:hypothetical protein